VANTLNKSVPKPKLDTDPLGDVLSPGETRRHLPLLLTAPPASPHNDFPALISEQDINQAKAGELFIQVGIAFIYRDGFGNKRTSQRWFMWEPETNLFRTSGSFQD
jgi:hypothetical protein